MFDLFWERSKLDKTPIALIYLFNVLTSLGFHTPQRLKNVYTYYAVILKFTTCIVIPLVFNLGYILDLKILTGNQILTAVQAGINAVGMPFKFLAILVNMDGFRRAQEIMTVLDGRCDKPSEFAIIRRTAIMGNRFVMLYFIVYTMYGGSTFITSVAMGSPPYQLYLPFLNWHDRRLDFWIQVSFEFVLFGILLTSEVFADSYGGIYIYIIRSHLHILTDRVRDLGRQSEKSLDTNYEELVQCIVDHKVLLDLHETIGAIISMTIFVQFLITAVMLGCTMINIFVFANTSAQVACCFYIVTVLLQIFPCCYHATGLLWDCEALTLAIFQCNWIDQDVRFRKMLLFFMHRSQKTMTLTANKLFPINLGTNFSIAKFSFSLYTLIKKMDFGQKNE